MKILLVDDSAKHRGGGERDLETLGHEVVVISNYEEGLARIMENEERFDVALLDLLMPAEAYMLSPDAQAAHLGREIGVGYPLIFVMAAYGIKHIAVVTDGNHHHHPVVATVDWVCRDTFTVNGSKVLIRYAGLTPDGAKDWAQILSELLE